MCQKARRKINNTAPELHSIPVVAPWHHIGIDFVGPILAPSAKGSHYILTIADYFSKWVEAIPTATKQASVVAAALFKVVYNFEQYVEV